MLNYLIQALRAYRVRTEHQFGQVTESILPLTQDAANALEQLQSQVERGLIVSLDGKNQTNGHVSTVRWEDIARMLEDKDGTRYRVVTLMPKPHGLEIVWEWK